MSGRFRTQRAHGFQLVAGSALVFTTCTGEPENRRNALRAVKAASARAELDQEQVNRRTGGTVTVKVGLHDLRHGAASNE